jgi:chromosome partitioning protein
MVISIASQKGGTGKTSTTISLAAGLAHKGKKVLLVDIDSQANSSKVLLREYQKITKEQTIYTTIIERKALPVHPTFVRNLSVVPSHILLSNTDIELTTAKDHREARLKSELDKIKAHYDYIFIDNPPALGWLTLNSFTASDQVLIVVSPGYFELDSLVQLGKTLEEVREYFNHDLGRAHDQHLRLVANSAPDLHRKGVKNRDPPQHGSARRPLSKAGHFLLQSPRQSGARL